MLERLPPESVAPEVEAFTVAADVATDVMLYQPGIQFAPFAMYNQAPMSVDLKAYELDENIGVAVLAEMAVPSVAIPV